MGTRSFADPVVALLTPSSCRRRSTGGAHATDTRPALMDRLVGQRGAGLPPGRRGKIRHRHPARAGDPLTADTRLANAPPFLKGVVNLRGEIVPVIDPGGMQFSLQA